MNTFETFSNGKLVLPLKEVEFKEIKWNKHPAFEGVELKQIVSTSETDGVFSYSLVKIAPGCSIGEHIHETQLETHEVIGGSGICKNDGVTMEYKPGVISIMPAQVKHEVTAGEDGLYMFAKFISSEKTPTSTGGEYVRNPSQRGPISD